MPSWASVIVGAVLVGGILGAAQRQDTPAEPPAPTSTPQQVPLPAPTVATSTPLPSPASALPTAPPDTWPAGVHAELPPGDARAIALTFDDGPDRRWTPLVLDELARHDASATFCVVGSKVPGNEDLVRRIHAEGHTLCNHTQSHDYGLPVRESARVAGEIADATAVVAAAEPDADVQAFRAPGGRFAPSVVDAAAQQGLTSWAWTIDPRDWDATDPEPVVTAVLDEVAPGAVVLLHDAGGDRSATVRALAELIPVLQSVGYEFVGLPDVD